jgi:hypothetical protein
VKVDFDSILYIVITLVIIVISALGSRRKRLQKTQAPAPPGTDPVEPVEKKTPFTDFIKEAAQAVSADTYEASETDLQQKTATPLERLEQFLTGQEPGYASTEGESLETIVDEEEQILEEMQADSEEEQHELIGHEPDIDAIRKADSEKNHLDLFTDVDEIKKAVIYSEILKRKYD